MATPLELARRRLQTLYQRASGRLSGLGRGIASTLTRDAPSALSEREAAALASFTNQELLEDRTREFEFTARDPRTGRTGTFRASGNSLHLVEPSYDAARARIEARLASWLAQGLLSRTPPGSELQSPPRGPVEADGQIRGHLPNDTRLVSGLWADFPPYGGISNDHLNVAGTALGVSPRSGQVLPNFPLPLRWEKLYPTPKLLDVRAFPVVAMVRELRELTVDLALMLKGANANPEWHPALMAFNNGTQFPSREYPPDVGPAAFDDVAGRYQYKRDHRWAVTTQGARGSATGLLTPGETDPLWIASAGYRQRIYRAENHQMAFSNDWGIIEAADAVADFVRWANCARFLCDLGALAHVHACAECHNAVASKAERELGIAVSGGPRDEYRAAVAGEREARQIKSRRVRYEEFKAGLTLAAEAREREAVSTTMDVLNGGLVASVSLFKLNPVVGGVGLLVTGIASVLAYFLSGGGEARREPERILVRDGTVRVRDRDEADDPQGDVFGGNSYPWTRDAALSGIPALRAKDASGRLYE